MEGNPKMNLQTTNQTSIETNMKRPLTHEEIVNELNFEDQIGICNLAQDMFCLKDKGVPVERIAVIGEFNDEGQIENLEVVEIGENNG
jgi:hypothetical protein